GAPSAPRLDRACSTTTANEPVQNGDQGLLLPASVSAQNQFAAFPKRGSQPRTVSEPLTKTSSQATFHYGAPECLQSAEQSLQALFWISSAQLGLYYRRTSCWQDQGLKGPC